MIDNPENADKRQENEQAEKIDLKLPEFLPLLPVRDIVVFP